MGPRQGSWDWSSHLRRGEDERERDDLWRNGSNMDDDRPNERAADRRKAYQKPVDHVGLRSTDERGGGGGGEGIRGSRDWHPRGSPQGTSQFSCIHRDFSLPAKCMCLKHRHLGGSFYYAHGCEPFVGFQTVFWVLSMNAFLTWL